MRALILKKVDESALYLSATFNGKPVQSFSAWCENVLGISKAVGSEGKKIAAFIDPAKPYQTIFKERHNLTDDFTYTNLKLMVALSSTQIDVAIANKTIVPRMNEKTMKAAVAKVLGKTIDDKPAKGAKKPAKGAKDNDGEGDKGVTAEGVITRVKIAVELFDKVIAYLSNIAGGADVDKVEASALIAELTNKEGDKQ